MLQTAELVNYFS
uniref:Uncharacterized protein n=1 Tax=Rhizophora mucronata TaxID=61149 RepID=A0A2P2R0Q8_RHIMU